VSASDGSVRPQSRSRERTPRNERTWPDGQLTRIEYRSRHLVFEVQSSPASAAGATTASVFLAAAFQRLGKREHSRVASAAAVLSDDGLVRVQGSVVLS
jgi:hypothetical protein